VFESQTGSPKIMLELWNRLFDLLHAGRAGQARRSPRRRYFALEESLELALLQRADQENRPAEQIQAELLTAGLAHLQSEDILKQCWDSLSEREQEVTALACLGFTNRQIAGRLHISIETAKSHVGNILSKFQLHSKADLRKALFNWDFRAWVQPQAGPGR
jgi:DNA-binding NarL/FixJ family response regulator